MIEKELANERNFGTLVMLIIPKEAQLVVKMTLCNPPDVPTTGYLNV
tara:strand:- start:1598 stop:1738 length:141 start_codon:yes stop_codon:yes gene_type:complete